VVWLDSRSNIIDTNSKDKLIALLGVNDLLIIETPDVLLVANKKYDQRIKEMVEELKKKKKDKFL
jgi:mannose-1-phosphate guanylyltransferase